MNAFAAIAKPSATEIPISASATTPDARLASHQTISIGSRCVMGSRSARRRSGSGFRDRAADRLRIAALASASASAALGAWAVAESTPVQAGRPVDGSTR